MILAFPREKCTLGARPQHVSKQWVGRGGDAPVWVQLHSVSVNIGRPKTSAHKAR